MSLFRQAALAWRHEALTDWWEPDPEALDHGRRARWWLWSFDRCPAVDGVPGEEWCGSRLGAESEQSRSAVRLSFGTSLQVTRARSACSVVAIRR